MKRLLIIGFTDCAFAFAPTMSASAMPPKQHPMRWAEPIRRLFRSKAATGMGMGGAIPAVAATTTVGTAATAMAGGIIAIGGDFHVKPKREKLQ